MKKYEKSKINFNILKLRETYNLKYFYDNSKIIYSENEWEIPKGRRNNHKKEIVLVLAAKFMEETNITEDKYKIINNIIPN